MNKVTLNAVYLKALIPLAAEKEVRVFLNGVFIEIHPGATIMVASNGVVLGALLDKINGMSNPADERLSFIMPIDFAKSITATAKHNPTIELQIKPLKKSTKFKATVDGQIFEGSSVDGEYPNWRRVVPADGGNKYEYTQFDPEKLALFMKTAKTIGTQLTKPYLTHMGDNKAARVMLPGIPEFTGVIMPLEVPKDGWPDHKSWHLNY